MGEKSTWHDEWANVDQANTPEFFVKFLDLTRAKWIEMARANPGEFYSFLDIKNGLHSFNGMYESGQKAICYLNFIRYLTTTRQFIRNETMR